MDFDSPASPSPQTLPSLSVVIPQHSSFYSTHACTHVVDFSLVLSPVESCPLLCVDARSLLPHIHFSVCLQTKQDKHLFWYPSQIICASACGLKPLNTRSGFSGLLLWCAGEAALTHFSVCGNMLLYYGVLDEPRGWTKGKGPVVIVLIFKAPNRSADFLMWKISLGIKRSFISRSDSGHP